MRFALVVFALLSAPLVHAAPRKVAVLPVEPGAGVDTKIAAALTEATAGALAKAGVEVVTQAQLKALLDHEARKQLAGCSNDACMAQLGEALGVDALVTGSLAKVGQSWLFGLRSVEVKDGASRLADRRIKGGSLDDVLDVLPGLVAELQARTPAQAAAPAPLAPAPPAPAPVAPPTASVAAPAASGPRPSSVADTPASLAPQARKRLKAVTDGKVVIAYDPKPEDSLAPIYATSRTDKTKLYAQRVFGGGREGTKSFDVTFWEPRAKAPWQASFGVKDGKAWLQCGDNKIELRPIAIPKRASFHGVRWQRRLFAMARTDDGTYFVVDRAREPDDSRDFHLWIGKRGALGPVKVDDALLEGDEQVFLTAQGRLKVTGAGAEWTAPGATAMALKRLEIEEQAGFAYGELGVYQEPLGTPCDGYLAR